MVKLKRAFFVIAGLFTLAVAAFSVAMPGAAGCLLIEYRGLDRLPDGTLVEGTLSAVERQQAMSLRRGARGRIDEFLGMVRGRPVVVFLNNPRALWPLRYNPFASTQFAGTRACVVVGPQGRNTDVVAHELMHAELFERVGPWRRQMSVPTWFDEGVAMQVDYRTAYDLPISNSEETGGVQSLDSAEKFFVQSDAELTRHYSFAKAEVAKWLARIGRQRLAERFEEIRAGKNFKEIWSE